MRSADEVGPERPPPPALFSAYSARQVSVIYAPANQYVVILEVLPQYQRTPEALSKLYLRSGNNALVPLESVVRTHRDRKSVV